ncbi:MAG: hypothetical protein M3R36_15970 [Bacteroidota bacterium]|nr:hypothetical protein [Bacteroidota bacterium]
MLKTFSKNEINEFDKFVRSPFHNNRSDVVRFFKALKKFHPSFNHLNFTKEKIYIKLYPDKKYKDEVMRLLGTQLKNIAKDYLSYKKFSENTFEKKINFITSLFDRNLFKILDKEIKETRQELKQNQLFSPDYFHKLYSISDMKVNINFFRGIKKGILENFSETVDNLIYFFITSLFIHIKNKRHYEISYNAKFDKGLLDRFLNSFNLDKMFNEIKRKPDAKNSLMLALYYSMKVDENPEDEEALTKYKELLTEYSSGFERETNTNLYYNLVNILHDRQKKKINSKGYKKMFEVFNEMTSKNVLTHSDSGYLQEEVIDVIIYVALGIDNWKWGEDFIEAIICKVHPDRRDSIYNFSKASFAHYRKEFNTALNFLSKVNPPRHVSLSFIKSRNLLCKIYYDLNCTEQLFSSIDSYRHYLRYDKAVTAEDKTKYLKFLSILSKLLRIKITYNEHALKILKKNLPSNLTSYKWLLEKIEELEKSNG